MSCGAKLQKYDLKRDEERAKFDLERDEVLRKVIAAGLGVKLSDGPSKTSQPPRANQEKRTMSREDLMRNYAK